MAANEPSLSTAVENVFLTILVSRIATALLALNTQVPGMQLVLLVQCLKYMLVIRILSRDRDIEEIQQQHAAQRDNTSWSVNLKFLLQFYLKPNF